MSKAYLDMHPEALYRDLWEAFYSMMLDQGLLDFSVNRKISAYRNRFTLALDTIEIVLDFQENAIHLLPAEGLMHHPLCLSLPPEIEDFLSPHLASHYLGILKHFLRALQSSSIQSVLRPRPLILIRDPFHLSRRIVQDFKRLNGPALMALIVPQNSWWPLWGEKLSRILRDNSCHVEIDLAALQITHPQYGISVQLRYFMEHQIQGFQKMTLPFKRFFLAQECRISMEEVLLSLPVLKEMSED